MKLFGQHISVVFEFRIYLITSAVSGSSMTVLDRSATCGGIVEIAIKIKEIIRKKSVKAPTLTKKYYFYVSLLHIITRY